MRQLDPVSRCLATALALLSFAVPAWATTYNPTTRAEFANAIAAAKDGDEIVVSGKINFNLNEVFSVANAVTIRGASASPASATLNFASYEIRIELNNAGAVLKDLTVLDGKPQSTERGVVKILAGGGLVSNCRFTGGKGLKGPSAVAMLAGRVTGCTFDNTSTRDKYGAVYINGATALFDHCILTNSTQTSKDAKRMGLVYVKDGTMSDCLVAGNKLKYSYAGGVYVDGKAVVRNCTIVNNETESADAGGLYWPQATGARIVNCIIAGNRAADGGEPEIMKSGTKQDALLPDVFLNNCVAGLDIGTACQKVDSVAGVKFIDYANKDYSLEFDSPAKDAGTSAQGLSTTDLIGQTRVLGAAVDIGAYECNTIACDFTATPTNGVLTTVFQLTAQAFGTSGSQTYAWTVSHDQGVAADACASGASFAFTPTELGTYTVKLVMTDGGVDVSRKRSACLLVTDYACDFTADADYGLAGREFRFTSQVSGLSEVPTYAWTFRNELTGTETKSTEANPVFVSSEAGRVSVTLEVTSSLGKTSKSKASFITVQVPRTYADPDSTTAAFPYDTPAKAASNIADAITACGDGGEVVLAQKTFKFAEPLVIERGVTVRGEGEREATTLKITAKSKHVVTVRNVAAVLKNVTITGANVGYEQKSGLVLESGLVTNVVISGNVSNATRAGPAAASVSGGRLTGSLICNNQGGHAAAMAIGIAGTEPNVKAGLGPEVDHCTVVDNFSDSGSSCYGAVGLGIGLMHDCLIARNSCSKGDTAGVRIGSYGTLYNCTIADNNSGTASAGGLYWASQPLARVVNCVIVGNTGSKCDWAKSGTTKDADLPKVFLNCLFDGTDIGGTNCKIASAGDTCQSLAGHDYSLVSGSVARDAGLASWSAINSKVTVTVGGVDFVGKDRVMGTAVDLGAYEYDPSALSCDIKAVGATAKFVGSTFSLMADVPEVEGTLTYDWTVRCGETELKSTEANPSFALTVPGRYDVALKVTLGQQQISATKLKYLHASPRQQTVTPDGLTLGEAIDMAIDGGEIRVSGAVSLETTAVVDKGITIAGTTGNATDKLVGKGKETVIRLNHKDAVVRGLTVTGGGNNNSHNGVAGGILIAEEGGTVEDCIVEKNKLGYYGTGVGIYTYDAATNAVIRRTIIRDNFCHAAPPGIAVSLGAGVMESCLITGNYGTGSPACAGVALRTDKTHVRNCTIVNHSGDGEKATASALFVVASALKSGSPEIINTVVAQNTNDAVAVSWRVGEQKQGGPLVDYNTNNFVKAFSRCAFDTDNVLDGMDVRVIANTDMGFTADGSYRLEKTSALRDGGRWQSWMTDATDLYGMPRVNCGKRVDIGCCEVPGGGGLLLLVR